MELKEYIMQQLVALDPIKTNKVEFEVNLDSRGYVRDRATGNVVRFTVDLSPKVSQKVNRDIMVDLAEYEKRKGL